MYAYSVAIKLSVANLASQGLRLIASDLMSAHGAATKLEGKLKALKLTAIGYGLDRAGSGIVGFLEKSVDASKEYTRQLSLMNAAGMTQKDIAESISAAWKTSHEVVTSTAADNLKMIRELRSVLGKDRLGEAYAALPIAQRVKATLEALTGRPQDKIGFEMVKAADLRTSGLMSQEAVTRNMELMGRTLMAMGGTINVNDFLQTLKYAKTSALTFNDEFVYKYLPTLMQEVKAAGGGQGGASRAGTALSSLYTAIVQGKVQKSAIPIWEAVGLIRPQDVVRNATGQYQIRPGGVKDAQLFEQNPLKWAEKYGPMIAAYAAGHHLTTTQLVSSLVTNSVAAWGLNTLIAKAPQFERDKQLVDSSRTTYGAYQTLLKTNPQLAEQALHSQWQNVLAVIGYKILPPLIPYMVKFANALSDLSGVMQKHPGLLNGIVIGIGAFAGTLMLLGKVMLYAGIIKFLGIGPTLLRILPMFGLVGIAIAAIGFAAYELWKHWDVIGPKLKAAWESIKTAVGEVADWIAAKWKWIAEHLGLTHLTSSSTGPPRVALSDRAIMVGTGRPIVVYSNIHMDGRKVATAVTKHQAAAAGAPQSGSSFFDGRGALAPAGGVGAQ